ncbi:MAG: hypothetical protein HMLKMBBP_02271 [Planctomycetes bacterium]|nr:hypothetical protein [Planctomycetota bacterium]
MRGRAVAVVGHEPWLSALAALLVTGSPRDASRFPLGRGGMLLLEGAPAPGTMVVAASFPPRALRRLGR